MTMRVGLNATCFNDRPSGARQRFVGIYGRLIANHPEIEFVIYDPVDTKVSNWFAGMPNVSARQTPVPSAGRLRKAKAGFGFWRKQIRADRLDLFEAFNIPLVKAPDCPTILTVHDIRQIGGDVSSPVRAAYRAIWRHALVGADHVITVSDTMRDDILAFHPRTKISTIYNGIDPAPFARAEANPADYILAVGHLEPRKNYGALIEAIGLLNDRGRPARLIIVGGDGGSQRDISAAIGARGLDDRITIRSDIDDAALTQLYADCQLVVFPSRYEGFGIPLIEAMAARRPVVSSDIAVFRELTEQQGVYFPTDDPAAIADAIDRVRTDPALAASLVAYGDKRVGDFAFDPLAEQVAALYRTLR